MGADREPPDGTDPVFAAYLRAKGAADDAVRARDGLDWTVLRPGRLTDGPGTGKVPLAEKTGRASVPRDDVAAVLAALLDAPGTAGADAGTDQRRCAGGGRRTRRGGALSCDARQGPSVASPPS